MRAVHDPAYHRWPPHLNVAYPCVPGRDLEQLAHTLAEHISVPPVRLSGQEFGTFAQGKHGAVGWLRPGMDEHGTGEPEPTSNARHGPPITLWWRQLAAQVMAAAPELAPANGREFVPHMTLGKWPGPSKASEALAGIAAAWRDDDEASPSGTWQVSQLQLLARPDGSSPFQVAWTIDLATRSVLPGPASTCDTSRVHTWAAPPAAWHGLQRMPGGGFGLPASSITETPAAYPLSSARVPAPAALATAAAAPGVRYLQAECSDESLVWYFAYGANMQHQKVKRSRGLQPLASVPAWLPSWLLAFSHRGGMATLAPASDAARHAWAAAVEAPAEWQAQCTAWPGAEPDVLVPAQHAPDPADALLCDSMRALGSSGVHGVLHLLREADAQALARAEHGYIAMALPVHTYGGTMVPAAAFISRIGQLLPGNSVRPPSHYTAMLSSCARDYGVHPAHAAAIRALPVVASISRSDSVYYSNAGGSMRRPAAHAQLLQFDAVA